MPAMRRIVAHYESLFQDRLNCLKFNIGVTIREMLIVVHIRLAGRH